MMIPMVFRSNIYSDFMQEAVIDSITLLDMVKNPGIYPSKETVPVAFYGHIVKNPVVNDHGQVRPLGMNAESISYYQLDFDDGYYTIDEFVNEYKDKFAFILYTSYSYGYKENDRFRVIIPLDEPLQCKDMGTYFKKAMDSVFHCDCSCHDRAHMQCVPSIRNPDAPYRYYINNTRNRFHIPWNLVAAEERKAIAMYMFNLALDNWYGYCDILLGHEHHEADPETLRVNALRWAQEQFDQCPVGARNNTMFSVLSWLKSKGITADDAFMLCPPAGVDNEFDRMVERIFYQI